MPLLARLQSEQLQSRGAHAVFQYGFYIRSPIFDYPSGTFLSNQTWPGSGLQQPSSGLVHDAPSPRGPPARDSFPEHTPIIDIFLASLVEY